MGSNNARPEQRVSGKRSEYASTIAKVLEGFYSESGKLQLLYWVMVRRCASTPVMGRGQQSWRHARAAVPARCWEDYRKAGALDAVMSVCRQNLQTLAKAGE